MLVVQENGLIEMYQGDTGDLTIEGLGTAYNYTVYFAIRNKHRVFIGDEMHVESNYNDSVTFSFAQSLTNKLIVPINQPYEDYFYGVKACTQGVENTLFIGDGYFDAKHILRVYPIQSKGTPAQ